jgi:uncharacterized protein with NAD-binding domain and iron-sulfur cluster
MAYVLEIDGVAWYFKPVYPVQVQHENENNTLEQKVDECVYASFGNATLCFKLKQTHAINAWAAGSSNIVGNFIGRVANFLFRGDDDGGSDGSGPDDH